MHAKGNLTHTGSWLIIKNDLQIADLHSINEKTSVIDCRFPAPPITFLNQTCLGSVELQKGKTQWVVLTS